MYREPFSRIYGITGGITDLGAACNPTSLPTALKLLTGHGRSRTLPCAVWDAGNMDGVAVESVNQNVRQGARTNSRVPSTLPTRPSTTKFGKFAGESYIVRMMRGAWNGRFVFTPFILQKSRMRRRSRTDLCGARSAMIVPTATMWLLSSAVTAKSEGRNSQRTSVGQQPLPIPHDGSSPSQLPHT
jgi:hypothetical protein